MARRFPTEQVASPRTRRIVAALASVGSPCGAPLQPVYRLYNNREGEARPNHRYTISPVLAGQLVAQGWTNEGIGFCAAP